MYMKRFALITVASTVLAFAWGCPSSGPIVVCVGPVTVDTALTGDTVWAEVNVDSTCVDYEVTTNLDFDSLLTIEPGVVVAFAVDTHLRVIAGGALNAVGTADEPILLTGMLAQRGFWNGVVYENTQRTENQLAYVTIEYAGGEDLADQPANLASDQGAVVSLSNVTLRESGGYGLFVERNATATFADSVSTQNTLGPAFASTSSVHNLLGSSSYTGNDVDEIHVSPNEADGTYTWENTGVPLRVLTDLNAEGFNITGDLTIMPGVIVMFEAGMRMMVTGSSSLRAMGTATQPIVFTGTQATPGYWCGVYAKDTNLTFDNVTVEYGGCAEKGGFTANLTCDSSDITSTSCSVTNSTLRGSGAFGMGVRFGVAFADFTGNTLEDNVEGAAQVFASNIHHLRTSSSYDGDVDVFANHIEQAVTWDNLGVDYVVQADLDTQAFSVDAGGNLTISPGVTIRFENDMALGVIHGGSLTAVGTETEKISFIADANGWRGLWVQWGTMTFDYIVVNNAGSIAKLSDSPAAVTIVNGGQGGDSYVDFGSVTEGTGNPNGVAFDSFNAFAVETPGCFGMGGIIRSSPTPQPKCN